MTFVERRAGLAALGVGGLVLCLVLLRFPPGSYGFYPVCPVYAWTGLLCPGCGGTRAIAALLRGDLREALRLNALIVGLVPFAAGYGAVIGRQVWRGEAGRVRVSAGIWVGIGLVAAVFGLVRNLRWSGF